MVAPLFNDGRHFLEVVAPLLNDGRHFLEAIGSHFLKVVAPLFDDGRHFLEVGRHMESTACGGSQRLQVRILLENRVSVTPGDSFF